MLTGTGLLQSSIIRIFYSTFTLFYSLFLGICNSERAAEAIVQSPISGSPVIALRFNSIRIDYSSNSGSSVTFRTVKLPQCAVRVDIYNGIDRRIVIMQKIIFFLF